MLPFPIELQDLSVWLAINAIILLATSEVLSPEYGETHIYVNGKRLRIAALTVTALFFITVVIRILGVIHAK